FTRVDPGPGAVPVAPKPRSFRCDVSFGLQKKQAFACCAEPSRQQFFAGRWLRRAAAVNLRPPVARHTATYRFISVASGPSPEQKSEQECLRAQHLAMFAE